MSQFIQLHVLTAYPPANLNRDDLGRPKTAEMGGVTRLRISSQSLKRAWRTSEIFQQALAGKVGTRTKRVGRQVLEALLKAGMAEEKAKKVAGAIAAKLGKPGDDGVSTEQLVHVSPQEHAAILELAETLGKEMREPTEEELKVLRRDFQAADIALFGRMVAANSEFNMEAAAQVAHAVTVHRTVVEDDYFTAVDDLNDPSENAEGSDSGAGHVGEAGFAAGLFYTYVCIDRETLKKNLGGDEDLTQRTLAAFAEAVLKVAPSGKQASFASRAYASFCLAEKGDQQPRSLAVAFYKPVAGKDFLTEAIAHLNQAWTKMDQTYGPTAAERYPFSVPEGQGTAAELVAFISRPLGAGGA